MEKKICLVTGASDGIGKEVAMQIAKMGATVVLLCRNREKGEAARSEISKLTGNVPHLLICDLGSQIQIRNTAEEFNQKYPKLDILIHNAASFYTEQKKSAGGIEMQFEVNHLSSFLLTHLLIPKMKAASKARLIVTSSRAQYGAEIRLSDYNFDNRTYDGHHAYKQSKLANILFANEFARRFRAEGITANSLHPGLVRTRIAQKDSKGVYPVLWAMLKLFGISIRKGAATTVYLATDPRASEFTGMYFEKCKPVRPDPVSQDLELAKQLWDLSLKLTGIQEFGKP